MNLKFTANFALFLTIIVVLLLGIHPAWQEHLHTDVNVYVDRVNYFLKNGDFKNLSGNEYQPGALIFFTLIHFFIPQFNPLEITLNSYLWKLFAVNIILILTLGCFYEKYTKNFKSKFVLILIILATGPIVLYRFDLFVMTLIVTSLYFFKQTKIFLASFLLGTATLVKIFPILLLPYFLIVEYRKGNFPSLYKILFSFTAGYIGFLTLFKLTFDASLSSVFSSFYFLSQTPVHTESIWGTFLTLGARITTGEFARGSGGWGIFGISPEYTVGPLWLYNYFWVIPIVLWYIWLFKRGSKFLKTFDIRVTTATVLIFLIFSKILHHQYLMWFMLLLPLVDPNLYFRQTKWFALLILVAFASFINQYVYPLNYTKWMFGFYVDGSFTYLFWLVFLRNALLVSILILLIGFIADRFVKRS